MQILQRYVCNKLDFMILYRFFTNKPKGYKSNLQNKWKLLYTRFLYDDEFNRTFVLVETTDSIIVFPSSFCKANDFKRMLAFVENILEGLQ